MRRLWRSGLLALVLASVSSALPAKPLPSALTSAILLKLLSLEAGVQDEAGISIWVVNDPALASQLEKRLGKAVGRGVLTAVYRDSLPEGARPDLVYINSRSQLEAVLVAAHQLGSITVSPEPDHAARGVVLIVHDDQGLPSITINMPPSRSLNLHWDPSVLQIADVIY